MDINQEAILKQQGHIQALLKVRVCPHKPCQRETPLRARQPPHAPGPARQHVQYLILQTVSNHVTVLLIKTNLFVTRCERLILLLRGL